MDTDDLEDSEGEALQDVLGEVEEWQGQGKRRPKKVDIDKMHTYRDEIRDEEGERVVEYASILYPGGDVIWGSGIEALQAVPGVRSTSHIKAVLREALR